MGGELIELIKEGWILTESALKSMESGGSTKNFIKTLLDRDLREIGAGVSELHKGKFESVEHEKVILQILKIRNISAPKANEASKTAPKLLKLQLTDGVNSYSAIEMESTSMSIETKPGTKIALKVKQMKMSNGQLLFTPKNIDVLGGNVEALVSKWELTRSLAGMKGSRTGVAGGPPPFIPFGQKIQQNVTNNDKGFKSLQQNKTEKSEIDDSEFKAQRQDAIAEASKAGTKKTFGGGSKTLVDSNVQKIMDKGFTEEQATTALRFSRNNVEKALVNLKRREEHRQRANSNDYEPREYSKDKRGGKSGSAEPQSAKPSGAVSLFAFLEDKFPTPQEAAAKHSSSSYSEERFENNISSSFRKHDKDISNKSQHWSQNSYGGGEQKSSHNVKSSNSYNSRDYREGGRDQPRGYRDSRDSREQRDMRDPRDSRDTRDGDSRRESKYQQSNNSYSLKPNTTAPNQYQKPSSAINNGASSNYNSSSKGKYQKPDYNNSSSGRSGGGDFKKDYNKDYNKEYNKDYNSFAPPSSSARDNNYNKPRINNSSAPSKYYNEHPPNDYHKSNRNVVESMEKMSLKGNQQQYKGADSKLSASNYPPLIPTTEPPKSNAFTTKPGQYPIVGFQNKEANEHAKNALKTKNIPGVQQQQQHHQQPPKPPSSWQQPPPTQQQQHQMPVKVIKNQPPPPFPNVQAPPNQAPMHSLPQPFVQHQQHQVIHAMPAAAVIPANPPTAVFHQTINFPGPIMMQSVQPPPGMAPQPINPQQLKIDDFCLAKYWEDGQFYNAKITGISESTYVVLFTDYGNAEEVRKNDCVPLIAACPTTPHSANYVPASQMNAYRISTQKMPPPHNYHQQQAQPVPSMPYKNVPGKNQRR